MKYFRRRQGTAKPPREQSRTPGRLEKFHGGGEYFLRFRPGREAPAKTDRGSTALDNMENALVSESHPLREHTREHARTVPDEALLRRAQQANQTQILSKLLHDLRNPVHSIRITMELFGRLARRTGNLDEMIERAALYIGPAEAALDSLLSNTERLGHWLAGPVAPAIVPLAVRDWCEEIAVLLRASRRRLQVTVSGADTGMRMLADRPRLGHGVLQYCLANASSQAALSAREDNDRVVLDLRFGAPDDTTSAGPSVGPAALSGEELRELLRNAGGALIESDPGCLVLSFPRSAG
jgi:hypothetical protein